MKEACTDKDGKISHKRIIAILCCANSLILCWLYVIYGIGNMTLISIFLGVATGEGLFSLLE